MIRLDFDNGQSCMIPAHIMGSHHRASRKCREANYRYGRLLINIGKMSYVRNARNARRANCHDHNTAYWSERMQAIVAYLPNGPKYIPVEVKPNE